MGKNYKLAFALLAGVALGSPSSRDFMLK